MAAFTTVASGKNWSETGASGSGTSPWRASGTGAVPVAGDTVKIANGHLLIVDTSQTVGIAATLDGLIIGDGGTLPTLQINTGATLTLLTTRVLSYGDLVMQAGSNMLFNSTGDCRWLNYNNASTRAADILINGTAGSRCSIKGSSGKTFYFSYSTPSRNITASYCDYQYSSGPAVAISGLSEVSVSITNCTFDRSAAPVTIASNMSAAINLTISGNVFTNTTGASCLAIRSGATATGTRLVYGNSFDLGINSNAGGWLNFTIDSNVFNTGIAAGTANLPVYTSALGNWTTFQNNLVRFPSINSPMFQQGPMINNIFLTDHVAVQDPNCVQINEIYSGTGTMGVFQGNIYQAYCLNNNGAFYYASTPYNPASTTTIRCLNNLILTNINGGGGSASVFNVTKMPATVTATIEHNTVPTGGSTFVGAILIGDQSGVVAGTLASVRGNLCYGTATAPGSKNGVMVYSSSTVPVDTCLAANCGYNGGDYMYASTGAGVPSVPGYFNGNGANMFSGTPSSNTTDVSSTVASPDPQFVDSTRNLATAYTVYFGQTSAGTTAQNFQALTGYIANQIAATPTTISALATWIKAGFAPKNATYNVTWGTDTNAVTNIGAVQGTFGYIDTYFNSSFADYSGGFA